MNTLLFPNNVSRPKKQFRYVLEWFVLAIVVFASTTLSINPVAEPKTELEVDHIYGSIILSTRSSMNALGLGEDVDTGAIATVDIMVNSVISEGCITCENTPMGIQMNGNIIIQNIQGGMGGLGRVEGTLSLTYLREYVGENFIGKEWLSVEWNASGGSELDTYWEFIITHNPPKWNLDERYNAAFISVDENEESRTGPWMLAKTLLNGSLEVQGCLPDSLPCEKSVKPDINLISSKKLISSPIVIAHPDELKKVENVNSTNETPTKMDNIRQLLGVENEVESHNIWCPENSNNIIATKSWKLSGSNNQIIAPMGLWFEILNLPSSSFNQINGTWTEIEFNDLSCATITDKYNNFNIGIITK